MSMRKNKLLVTLALAFSMFSENGIVIAGDSIASRPYWEYRDWKTEALSNDKYQYTTNGEVDNGNQFGFRLGKSNCSSSVFWLTTSNYKKGLSEFEGKDVRLAVKVDDKEPFVIVPLVTIFKFTPITAVALFSNVVASDEFIQDLKQGDSVSFTVTELSQITSKFDIKTESFSLSGFSAHHLKATEACKKGDKELTIASLISKKQIHKDKLSDPQIEQYSKVRANLSINNQQCLDSLVSQYKYYGNDLKFAKQKAIDVFSAAELIRELIKSKDSHGIAKLIPSQLTRGPIKQSIIAKPFGEVFPKGWVDNFEKNWSYPCGELQSNLILGDPKSPLWFNVNLEGAPRIISVIGLQEKSEKTIQANKWVYKGTAINANCFTTHWNSGDNYEEFAETFNLGKYGDPIYDDFVTHPGTFIGKQIPIDMVLDPWPLITLPLHLSPTLKECNSFSDRDGPLKYITHGSYKLTSCEDLAPNIQGSCVDMKLVQVNGPFGYSNVQSKTVLYGLFELTSARQTHVVPLLNFDLLNQGIVETQKYLKIESSN